jgi:hypothetical protein
MLFNLAGFYIFFSVQIAIHHGRMQQTVSKLSHDGLQKIVLTRKHYNSIRVGDDEIQLDGKMYDIASIRTVGDKVILFAEHDVFEDEMLALVEAIFNSPLDKQGIPAGAIDFIFLDFVHSNFNINFATAFVESISTKYAFAVKESFQTRPFLPPKI